MISDEQLVAARCIKLIRAAHFAGGSPEWWIKREFFPFNPSFSEYMSIVSKEDIYDDPVEFTVLSDTIHGIQDIWIWIGLGHNPDDVRILVSNTKSKFDYDNYFHIQRATMKHDNTRCILPDDIVAMVIRWLELNQEAFDELASGVNGSTCAFEQKLVKIL